MVRLFTSTNELLKVDECEICSGMDVVIEIGRAVLVCEFNRFGGNIVRIAEKGAIIFEC
jgi:hypothetical protein